MVSTLRGRQTQFYIDICYGIAFSAGFGYLLVFGMDPRVAAFMGGLVLGYFLRVWENMSVYERILEEEVASKAETQVAEELNEQVPQRVEEQVTTEAEEQVAEELDERVEERVTSEAEEQVAHEVEDRVADELEAQISEADERSVADNVEAELYDRIAAVDEELAETVREHLGDVDAREEGETAE